MKKIFIILALFFLLNIINVKATSTIVMDLDSGRILYENNAYERKLIASTTKIMTFVVAVEYGEYLLDEMVEAKEEILSMYGTSIYLNYREKMSLRDLLYGLMLRSGNDAAVVIANYIAGSEEAFAKLMNEKALEIGMHNTIFRNSHGLDEDTQNYSTAYDMALLSCYAYKIPLYREISGTKYHKVQTENKAYSWTNRNKLLFLYDNLTGGKTGYTPNAGKTYVSTASLNNLNLTIVTLDDPNHYEHHELLYNDFFNTYKNYVIVSKNQFNNSQKLQNKNLYLLNDIVYPLKENELKNISYRIIESTSDQYIEVLFKDKVVSKYKLYKQNKIQNNKKTFWQKLIDFFK